MTIQDVALLLNLVLERRTLTGFEALRYIKEKLKRNNASTRAHLRRYEGLMPKGETCLTL